MSSLASKLLTVAFGVAKCDKTENKVKFFMRTIIAATMMTRFVSSVLKHNVLRCIHRIITLCKCDQ